MTDKPWEFQLVSNEEFIDHMRQGRVQEELIQRYAKRLGVDLKAEGSMVSSSQDVASVGVRSNSKSNSRSRRGIKGELTLSNFDQWYEAMMIYSGLGRESLLNWMGLQSYDDSAKSYVLNSVKSYAAEYSLGEGVNSSTGPRTLAAWRLYEISQKLKEGGLSYKETVAMMAKEAEISPKEVKDIIGTSEEWREGVFDYGLEPLHQDEAEFVQSRMDREIAEETERILSAVVARQDPIKDQFLSGQINLVEAIDEMVAAGLDYEEARAIADTWLPQ
jgi:hypothetical protein